MKNKKSRKAVSRGTMVKDLKVGDVYEIAGTQYTITAKIKATKSGMHWWQTLIVKSVHGIEDPTYTTTDTVNKI